MSAEPEETFSVEYPCDRHCLIEVRLTDDHASFTHRQMRAKADRFHELAHLPEPEPTASRETVTAVFRPAGR